MKTIKNTNILILICLAIVLVGIFAFDTMQPIKNNIALGFDEIGIEGFTNNPSVDNVSPMSSKEKPTYDLNDPANKAELSNEKYIDTIIIL